MDAKIKRGEKVTIRPEWRDKGEEGITFVASEDDNGSGRIVIEAQLGWTINPQQSVGVHMIERAV